MTMTTSLPTILYKYRGFNDFTKNILSDGEIYFATTDQLNDQNEKGAFRFKNSENWINNNKNELVCLSAEEYTQRLKNAFRQGKNELNGILSLCKNNKSLKMWKEYADNSTGICLGFAWEEFDLYNPGSYPPTKAYPIECIYQENFIEVEGLYATTEEVIKILTTKLLPYSYEEEWRMFYKRGTFRSRNVRYAIKEIIFGHNISEKYIALVKNLVKDLVHINFFITELTENGELQIGVL